MMREALKQWVAQCQSERELETKIIKISEKQRWRCICLGVLQSFTASQLLA